MMLRLDYIPKSEYVQEWSNSEINIFALQGVQPYHQEIETKWIGSTFFVLLTRTVPVQISITI